MASWTSLLLPAWSPSSVRAALTAALLRSTRLQAGIATGPSIPPCSHQTWSGPSSTRADSSASICTRQRKSTRWPPWRSRVGASMSTTKTSRPAPIRAGRSRPAAAREDARVILGLNVEASLVVRLKDSSALFAAPDTFAMPEAARHGAPRGARRAARSTFRRTVPLPGHDPPLRPAVGLRRLGRRHLFLASAVRPSEGPAVRRVAARWPDQGGLFNAN